MTMPAQRPLRYVLCAVVTMMLLLPAPRPATAQAQIGEVPAARVEALLEQLQDPDADVRRIAAIRVQNLAGGAYEAVERASHDSALDPGSLRALRAAVPLLKARARWANYHNVNYQDNRRTALEAYDQVGNKDPAWDAAVKRGIEIYVKPQALRTDEETIEAAVASFRQAVAAGCKDPFALYLGCRAELELKGADRRAVLARHRAAVFALDKSKYPADRIVGAAARYAQQFDTPEPQVMEICTRHLAGALSGKTPRRREYISELVDMVYAGLSKVQGNEAAFDAIYPVYAAARPADDPGPHVFKGQRYTKYAWEARGSGYANTVTPEGWKLFGERLAAAREALTKAWELDPLDERAPTAMITVCLGDGTGRAEMEKWFRRAMDANPDNRQACHDKLYFLYPRWHGSHQEMIAFGRECMATQNWWGPLPTILVDAHDQVGRERGEGKAYMARPAVWADLKEVYGSFLDAFPDSPRAPWYRNRLAKWACAAGRWQDADKLLRAIGDAPDLAVFRSQAVFEYYRKKAARKATEPAEPPLPPVRRGAHDERASCLQWQTHNTNGRSAAARSNDGLLDLKLPEPHSATENLFGAVWSASYMGAIQRSASQRRIKLPAELAVDAQIDIRAANGVAYSLRARLAVSVPGIERDQAQALIEAGHRRRAGVAWPRYTQRSRVTHPKEGDVFGAPVTEAPGTAKRSACASLICRLSASTARGMASTAPGSLTFTRGGATATICQHGGRPTLRPANRLGR